MPPPRPAGPSAQVDRLRGDDQLQRDQPVQQADQRRGGADRQRRHRGVILDALGQLAAVVQGDGIGQQPRLGGERGERAAQRPQAAGRSLPLRQPGRQPAEVMPEQLLDALVGDLGGVGDAQAHVVKGHRQRGHVEVADRHDRALVDEHQRVVAGGVQLDLHHPARDRERVVDGAVGLGHAADRERVLEVAGRPGAPQRRALQQLAQPRHRRAQPGVRAGRGRPPDGSPTGWRRTPRRSAPPRSASTRPDRRRRPGPASRGRS